MHDEVIPFVFDDEAALPGGPGKRIAKVILPLARDIQMGTIGRVSLGHSRLAVRPRLSVGLAVSPALFTSSAVMGGGSGFFISAVCRMTFSTVKSGLIRLMISISTSRGMVVGVSSSRRGHSSGGNWAEKLASCLVLSFLKLSRNNLSPNFLDCFSPSFGLERVSVLYEKLTVLLLFSVAGTWQREGGQ